MGADEDDFKSFAKASSLTYNITESDRTEDPPQEKTPAQIA